MQGYWILVCWKGTVFVLPDYLLCAEPLYLILLVAIITRLFKLPFLALNPFSTWKEGKIPWKCHSSNGLIFVLKTHLIAGDNIFVQRYVNTNTND